MDPPKGSSGTGHIEDVNGGEGILFPITHPPPLLFLFWKKIKGYYFVLFI